MRSGRLLNNKRQKGSMAYDMSRITERLWIGANINDEADVNDVRAAGVTNVIDCNTDDESRLFPATADTRLLSDPTEDDGGPKGPANKV
jgi:hypothetical protein